MLTSLEFREAHDLSLDIGLSSRQCQVDLLLFRHGYKLSWSSIYRDGSTDDVLDLLAHGDCLFLKVYSKPLCKEELIKIFRRHADAGDGLQS